MTEKQLLEEIDNFIAQIKEIPANRNYWLIRTQSGKFYDSFRTHNFVAIEHVQISLYEVNQILERNNKDEKTSLKELKSLAKKKYPDDRFGLIAGQIMKFVVELKKGDIVIIPSENSETISIGEITSSVIPELTQSELTQKDTFKPLTQNYSVTVGGALVTKDTDEFDYIIIGSVTID